MREQEQCDFKECFSHNHALSLLTARPSTRANLDGLCLVLLTHKIQAKKLKLQQMSHLYHIFPSIHYLYQLMR